MIELDCYSLKKNEFYVFDIFKSLPKNYQKKNGKIHAVPKELMDQGVIIFSGNVKGLDIPVEGITSEDVFMGVKRNSNTLELKKVYPGQCIIFCDFFFMMVDEDSLNEYFTKYNFFEQPIQMN